MQRDFDGLEETVGEEGWKQARNALFFSLDFLENSTHNPMRYCIQASVLLLFCGICMCVMCVHLP